MQAATELWRAELFHGRTQQGADQGRPWLAPRNGTKLQGCGGHRCHHEPCHCHHKRVPITCLPLHQPRRHLLRWPISTQAIGAQMLQSLLPLIIEKISIQCCHINPFLPVSISLTEIKMVNMSPFPPSYQSEATSASMPALLSCDRLHLGSAQEHSGKWCYSTHSVILFGV